MKKAFIPSMVPCLSEHRTQDYRRGPSWQEETILEGSSVPSSYVIITDPAGWQGNLKNQTTSILRPERKVRSVLGQCLMPKGQTTCWERRGQRPRHRLTGRASQWVTRSMFLYWWHSEGALPTVSLFLYFAFLVTGSYSFPEVLVSLGLGVLAQVDERELLHSESSFA